MVSSLAPQAHPSHPSAAVQGRTAHNCARAVRQVRPRRPVSKRNDRKNGTAHPVHGRPDFGHGSVVKDAYDGHIRDAVMCDDHLPLQLFLRTRRSDRVRWSGVEVQIIGGG
ncbi:hypothetical protein Zmor_016648 [Zophobas morio]|uniref:Uncharacterized protein n=1 Tax=Zophobas morio TaxID=2755281 RepID=A0AA38MBN8_9CUCU|nr:hypothetical protein Zmor_016648 [Zophobas morio]